MFSSGVYRVLSLKDREIHAAGQVLAKVIGPQEEGAVLEIFNLFCIFEEEVVLEK